METRLGKIQSVYFGRGGYQDCHFGLFLDLGGDDWGVGAAGPNSFWDTSMECSDTHKWTEQSRSDAYSKEMRFISETLNKAKVNSVEKLKGIAVEVTFDGQILKSWRILEEVL